MTNVDNMISDYLATQIINVAANNLDNLYETFIVAKEYGHSLCSAIGSVIFQEQFETLFDDLLPEKKIEMRHDILEQTHKFVMMHVDIAHKTDSKMNDFIVDTYNKNKPIKLTDDINEHAKSTKPIKNITKQNSKNETNVKQFTKQFETITQTIQKQTPQSILNKDTFEPIFKYGEIATQIGVLTHKQDLINTGCGIIGAMGIFKNLALVPTPDNIIGVLNGIIQLTGAFRKNKQDETFKNFALSVMNLLATIRQEMHELFDKTFKMLNSNQQELLNKFCSVDNKLENLMNLCNLIETKQTNFYNNLIKSNIQIQHVCTDILNKITDTNIIAQKISIMNDIRRLQLESKDKFDNNLIELLAKINTINDILSGTSLNHNLPYEFNINAMVNYVTKFDFYIFQTKHIARYIEEKLNCVTKIIVTSDDLASLIEDGIIIIFDNMGHLSFMQIIYANEITYSGLYYGTYEDYVKNVSLSNVKNVSLCNFKNPIKHVPCKEHEALNIFMSVNDIKYNDSDVQTINQCSNINITNLQNPIFFALLLNTIIDKIESNEYISGFIADNVFAEMLGIIPKIFDYYKFAQLCRHNTRLSKLLVLDIQNAFDALKQEFENYYMQQMNMLIDKQIIDLKKIDYPILIDNFRDEPITINYKYHSEWFYGRNWHHTGKFAGHDSWSAPIDSARDGLQTQLKDAYIKHMQEQITLAKDNAMKYIRNKTSSIDTFVFTKNNKSIQVPKILPPFILPYVQNKNLPILTIRDELYNLIPNNAYVLQLLSKQSIVLHYDINFYTNLAHIEINLCNGIHIGVIGLKYNPLFYVGKEAVLYWWYGGEIPIDGEVNTAERHGSYTDNRTTMHIKYPKYKTHPCIDFRTINIDTDVVFYPYKDDIDNKINEYYGKFIFKIKQTIFNDTNVSNKLSDLNFANCKLQMFLDCGQIEYKYDDCIYTQSQIGALDPYIEYHLQMDKPIKIKYLNANNGFKWLDIGNASYRYINMICNVKKYITSKMQPSKKLQYNKEVVNMLIFVIEALDINKSSEFDIASIIRTAYESYDQQLNCGIDITFGTHIKKTILSIGMPEHQKNHILRICNSL